MSPTETKIFKSLTKNEVSAQDISHNVGKSVRRVYKYLRRLRYKHHITKKPKSTSFKLTEKGYRLAKSITIAYNYL